MSGTRRTVFSETTVGQKVREGEKGAGEEHRITPLSGKKGVVAAGADFGSPLEHAASVRPTQLPRTGRKSLSPWGSQQVEFDGRGSFRRRPQVPTLGPLSYSLPVTPQERHGQEGFARDDEMDDLACEAAQGWSVPPMPYGDVADGASGADRSRRPQRFEQQGTCVDYSSACDPTTATQQPRPFLGRVRSDDGCSRPLPGSLTPESHVLVSGAAAALATAAAPAAATLVADSSTTRRRWTIDGKNWGAPRSQSGAVKRGDGDAGGVDGHHEDESAERKERRDARDGRSAGENKADNNDPSTVVATALEAAAAAETAFLLPPQLRQSLHSPLPSPPRPPDASLALAAVPTADPEQASVTEESQPEGQNEEFVGSAEAFLTAGGGLSTSAQTTTSESVLQRMAEACRQAGVILDPSLKEDIDSILSGSRSAFLEPPTTSSQPSAAERTQPPPPMSTTPVVSVETAVSSPHPARALGARADNPWGWAAPPLDDEGDDVGDDGRKGEVLLQETSRAPPSRDRSWTVPSPYQDLDVRFSSSRCVPDFRLDDGGATGPGEGAEEEHSSWRACSCDAAGSGDDDADDDSSGALADIVGRERELLSSWKACLSCGGTPVVVEEDDVAAASGVSAAASAEVQTIPMDLPQRMTAVNDAAIDFPEGASVADHEPSTGAAAHAVGSSAVPGTFASPLKSRLEDGGEDTGGGVGGRLGNAVRHDDLENIEMGVSDGGIGLAAPEQARTPSSEGENEGFQSGDHDERAMEGTGLGYETIDAAVEPRGRPEPPVISSTSPPPSMPQRYTQEEVELAAAIAEVSFEDERESRAERSLEGGQVGGGLPGEQEGAGAEAAAAAVMAATTENEDRASAMLGVGRFDLQYDDREAVDEWDDDFDPGYMVMAVSEQEFHGQLLSAEMDTRGGALVEGYRDSGGGGADLSTKCPSPSPGPETMEEAAAAAAAAFSPEGVPRHESDDGFGAGGPAVDGIEAGEEESTGATAAAAAAAAATNEIDSSWAGHGLSEFGEEEQFVASRQRASYGRGRMSEEGNAQWGENTVAAAVDDSERGPRHSGAPEGDQRWEGQYGDAQQRSLDVGGGGEEAVRQEGQGEEDYGGGDLYERDLEDAVALLENGGFLLDGEEVEAWTSGTFGKSAGGGGSRGRGCDVGASRDVENGGGEGDQNSKAVADTQDIFHLDSAGRRLAAEPSVAAVAAVSAQKHKVSDKSVVRHVDESGGGGWGNLSGVQQGRFGTNNYDDDGGGGGGGRADPAGREEVGNQGDSRETRHASPCKHSHVFSQASTSNAGAGKGLGAEGDPPGNFDPMSSLWPKAAADFAFSQDCGESPSFLTREEGRFPATEAGVIRDNSARTTPLDEAFHEEEHRDRVQHHANHHHDISIPSGKIVGSGTKRSGRDDGWRADTRQQHPAASAAVAGSGDCSGGTDGREGDRDIGVSINAVSAAASQHREALLHVREESRETMGGGGGVAGDAPLPLRAHGRINSAAYATDTATAQGGGRLLGGFGAGAGVEWAGGIVVAGAEQLLRDEILLEEADRDGRVSRRSRSGSSRRVLEDERSTRSRGYETASVVGARRAVGRCGDEGVEEQEDEEEELESFDLRVVYAKGRTGFQESKAFDWPEGCVVAGRYEVRGYIGKAAFSTALECRDLLRERGRDAVCLKVIKNNKDFFDQSLDEIKLLQRIKANGNPDENHVLHMLDFFYFEEHLVIVSELLGDNLYEFSKAVKEAGHPKYFTLPRLCKITRQCLEALSYINSLGLVHCDVKPENILLSHYGRAEVKLIDFGSSCFVTDRLTTYTQSRSYRAPEVIVGLPYGVKVDVWSLGAVVAELVTGHVLLQSESVQTMLARIQGIVGPFPRWMLLEGEESSKYFTPEGCVYQRMDDDSYRSSSSEGGSPGSNAGDSSLPSRSQREKDLDESANARYAIIYPKRTSLKSRLRVEDESFLDFVTTLLLIDPIRRPTAEEALRHPWILSGLSYTEDELWYPPEEHTNGVCDGNDGSGGASVCQDEDRDGGMVAINDYGGVGGGGERGGGDSTSSPRRQSF